jgi:hypothetical protein
LANCYAENGEENQGSEASIQIAHAEKQSLFSSLPFVKAVWRNHYGATPKQIRPPIFHQRAETCLTFRALV